MPVQQGGIADRFGQVRDKDFNTHEDSVAVSGWA
jgi:hypothetical protein